MPARRSGRRTVAEQRQDALDDALSPGDTYETSMTMGIKHRGNDYWIKEGVTVQVREGETGPEAKHRAQNFVYEAIHEQVLAITEED